MRKYGKSIKREVNYQILSTEEEVGIIKLLEDYPRRIKQAADTYEPSLICSYLIDLCLTFNRFYQKQRIITEDPRSTGARMLLAKGIQSALKSGLSILGIKAPERM
jgi:arginyl-tRNA synthetase